MSPTAAVIGVFFLGVCLVAYAANNGAKKLRAERAVVHGLAIAVCEEKMGAPAFDNSIEFEACYNEARQRIWTLKRLQE